MKYEEHQLKLVLSMCPTVFQVAAKANNSITANENKHQV